MPAIPKFLRKGVSIVASNPSSYSSPAGVELSVPHHHRDSIKDVSSRDNYSPSSVDSVKANGYAVAKQAIRNVHPIELRMSSDREAQRFLMERHASEREVPTWQRRHRQRPGLTYEERRSETGPQCESKLMKDWRALERLGGLELGERAYTEMVGLLARRGQVADAEAKLAEMQSRGLPCSEQVFVSIINAHAKRRDVPSALRAFKRCTEVHPAPSIRVYNTLLHAVLERREPLDANIAAVNALFAGCVIPPYDTVTYFYLFSVCASIAEVVRLRGEMGDVFVNSHRSVVLKRVMKAIPGPVGQPLPMEDTVEELLKFAQEMYDEADECSHTPKVPILAEALMNVFRNAGSFAAAEALFDTIPTQQRTQFSYGNMLFVFALRIKQQTTDAAVLSVLVAAEACFEEALVRHVGAEVVWESMMGCYAAANGVCAEAGAYRARAVALMALLLRKEAPDSHLLRQYLRTACEPEGVPTSLPHKLSPNARNRYAAQQADDAKKKQTEQARSKDWVLHDTKNVRQKHITMKSDKNDTGKKGYKERRKEEEEEAQFSSEFREVLRLL